MDSSNGQSQMDAPDWRSQLHIDFRHKIVNKIMESLKSHLPSPGQGVQELKQIAIRFEEKIYSDATNQSDYLRKISLKLLTMESKSQGTLSSAIPPNSLGRNPQDLGSSQNIQSQVQSQNKSTQIQMIPNQSELCQQFLAQNTQNTTESGGMHTSINLPNTLPTSVLVQNPMPNVVQTSGLQNITSISQSSRGNTMNQGIASDVLSNSERQSQGGLQLGSQQHQQTQKSQPLTYDLFQRPVLNNKFQKQNILQLRIQTQQQPSVMQSTSVMPPSTISGLQHNQQLPIQQLPKSVLRHHQQSVLGQQQQQPQRSPIIPQQTILGREAYAGNVEQISGNFQQTQLIAQQSVGNVQQSQLIGQQINITDMQQQVQQNSIQNKAPQQTTNHQNVQQQHHLMGQQSNFLNMHHQPLGYQNHVGGQQLVGTQSENISMQINQQTTRQVQPQTQNALPGSGGQQQEQLQSQPTQVQHQLGMGVQSISLQHNMKQRIPNIDPSLQQKNFMDRQILFQSRRATPERPSSSLDSTGQTDSLNVGDWQEEVYRKVLTMKDMYYADLIEIYRKISLKLQQPDSLPQQSNGDRLEKLRTIKQVLERLIQGLQITKNNISPSYVEKLPLFERQIVSLIHHRKNVPSVPQEQNILLQPNSQMLQLHSLDGGVNPQLQSMNMRRSKTGMSSLQHSSGPTVSTVASSQPNIPSLLQPGAKLPQQNVINLHIDTAMLQKQHLKQQEQQVQCQHLKQPIQNCYAPKQPTPQQLFNQPVKQVQDEFQNLRPVAVSHLSPAQHSENKQLNRGDSLPVLSPQLPNAGSSQIYQHSSPQIDQRNPPSSVPKDGTPLQSANSPFLPCPSTILLPCPLPGDNEKPSVSSLKNVANGDLEQTSAGLDCARGNASDAISGKSSVTEQPIERLVRAVKSISPKALTAAVSDISSVVSMVDRMAGSSPGNSSRSMVGEDLVTMTKCRLQARKLLTKGGSSGTKRMRQYMAAMPLNVGASVGSISDSLWQLNEPYLSELESTATSGVKKPKIEVNHILLEEIREINQRLIDTVVDISDQNMGQSIPAPAAKGSEGAIVKCSYNAITLSQSLRSQYMSNEMLQIRPLKLLVPDNYPNCSPVLLDKFAVDVSNGHEDLSVKAMSMFCSSLRSLSHPMYLKDIVRIWDDCARAVICEYAQLFGGGTFSSIYGSWENCLTAT